MIKENVRKEICLLLILSIVASLTFSQTIYATTANAAVYTQKNIEKQSLRLAAEQKTDDLTVNQDQTSVDNPSEEPSVMDQTNLPGISHELPTLNTEHLHLIAGGIPYELQVLNASNVSYELSKESPSIIDLSKETAHSVVITPITAGNTILIVNAIGSDGTQTVLTCEITVSELSLAEESVNLYLNDQNPNIDIAIQGLDLDTMYYETGKDWQDQCIRDAMNTDVQCMIRTGNSKIADAWFRDGSIHIKGIAKGITNARLTIYGVSFSIRIQVHHYTLNKYVISTYKGSSVKSLKLKGTQGHKVTWISGNKNVASVSKTGIVTINGIGTTKITAKVNGRKVICIVSVSSPTAYRVVKDAREISKKKNIQYSQNMRMSQNYYDCSSLVYRCYRPYGIRFGYTHPTWAPTAAEEGFWCKKSGHCIAEGALEILNCKLVPGDTIYYSFNGDNGRYMNIDHTAIFSGYAYDDSIGYYGTVIEASSSSNTVTERMYYSSDNIKLIGRPSKK